MSAWPTAVKVLVGMKGSSDSYLIEASDGRFYVIKHSRGPFKERLLVNETFASGLARRIGLPVPGTCPIVVPESLVRNEPGCLHSPWAAGLHFGAEFACELRLPVYDYLPRSLIARVNNSRAIAGCWIFDVWTGNWDQTQAVFYRPWRARKYRFLKIDHGWCFGVGNWIVEDHVRPFLCWQDPILPDSAFTTDALEPYFKRISRLSHEEIAASAADVPTEWLPGASDRRKLEQLVTCLARRAANLKEHARTCWPFDRFHSVASAGTR